MKRIIFTTSLSLLVLTGSSYATLIASEDFGSNANSGGLLGDGFGWEANWEDNSGTGQYFNNSTLFSGANIFNHSSDSYGFVGSGSERTGRNIDTSGGGLAGTAGVVDGNGNIGVDGTTVYVGIAFRAHKNPGAPTHYYGLELHRNGTGDVNRIMQLSTDGATSMLNLRANNDSGNIASITGLTDAVNYWVLKVDFGAGDADTLSAFLNPTLNALEGAPDGSISATDLSFDRISLANFGGNFVDFDDIRVGTAFEDVVGIATVVPEPSALALIGLGSLLLMRFRFKR